MRIISLVFVCLCSVSLSAQTPEPVFDGAKWEAPYHLDFPKGWDVERFLIPIEFAPQIPYKGIEDIRFAPGWGNPKTEEYWSYAFLWYLEGKPKTNAKTVETNLIAYYTGLVGRNIEPRKIPTEKLVTIKATIKEVKPQKGDAKTFVGSIYMLDYMEQKPITLNCIVHLKYCTGQSKTFIFNEISPKPYTDKLWESLNQLWINFSCEKRAESK